MIWGYKYAAFPLVLLHVVSFLSYCSMVATSSSRDGLRRPGRPRGLRGHTVVRRGGSGRCVASTDSPDRPAFSHRRPFCRLGRRACGSPSSSACSVPSSVSVDIDMLSGLSLFFFRSFGFC